jgi:hypothetical protein
METGQSSQPTNFSTIVLVAVIVLIVLLVIYYFAYYRNKDPGYLLSSNSYTTTGAGNQDIATIPMMSPVEIGKYLGENFTLSMYVIITGNTGSGPVTTAKGVANKNFEPIVWINGVGALVADMTTGDLYMVVTSTAYEPSDTAPTVNQIKLSNSGNNGNTAVNFLNAWNQITITVSGATVYVYVNGNKKGDSMQMTNVTISAPMGIYFLQGYGPATTVASLQAYPYVMNGTEVEYNYTNTSDGSKNPINVQIPGVTFAAIGRSIVNLFCKTGLCPSGTTSDVTLGPFTQINYEYS